MKTTEGKPQPSFAELAQNQHKRNWTEDFTHENGNYTNKCSICTEYFLGHKRRVVCKKCAELRRIN